MAASQAPVVSNTTPLINLVGVGLPDLLPALYGEVAIAEIVRDEYVAGMSAADTNLDSLAWLRTAPHVPLDTSLPPQLGAGEAAILSLASALKARVVLLDEAYGRRLAHSRGLPVVGTLGILLAAKQAGHLRAVAPIMDDMVRQGRHISALLRAKILHAAGE